MRGLEPPSRRFLVLSRRHLVLGSLSLPVAHAFAQDYPTRPIRFVVPFPAGGGVDMVARVLGERLAQSLGTGVAIENRAGAGGNIGLDAVAKAAPDGYTIALGQTSNLAINPTLYARIPYNPERDFAPVCLVAGGPMVLLVNADSPYRSLGDILTAAKAEPGMLRMGSPGTGTVGHLVGEMLQTAAQVRFQHIPYRGTSPALTDLLGKRIDLYFSTVPPALAQIQGKLLRGLAVSSEKRLADLPDVPTVAEFGYDGFVAISWYGVVAPAGTPAPIVDRLAVETRKAVDSAPVREKLGTEGLQVIAGTPEDFRAFLPREIAKWGKIVRDSGAKVD
jgi:tripartite-type tricarboxylate transporter receptor subunit TctC